VLLIALGSGMLYPQPVQAASAPAAPKTSPRHSRKVTVVAPTTTGTETVFSALLKGSKETPPVVTNARGVAKIGVNSDLTRLRYNLIARDLTNVTAAHIHSGPRGQAGPVGVTLFSGGTISIQFWASFASGTIGAPDPGNACGWTTIADVVAALRSGNAYVNYHTTAYPAGEVRGQLRPIR
jgi:hypothetical protein